MMRPMSLVGFVMMASALTVLGACRRSAGAAASDPARARLHRQQRGTTCALKAHIGVGPSVPASVPKLGPRTIIRQPTPPAEPIKNGPEIVDFRPVL